MTASKTSRWLVGENMLSNTPKTTGSGTVFRPVPESPKGTTLALDEALAEYADRIVELEEKAYERKHRHHEWGQHDYWDKYDQGDWDYFRGTEGDK